MPQNKQPAPFAFEIGFLPELLSDIVGRIATAGYSGFNAFDHVFAGFKHILEGRSGPVPEYLDELKSFYDNEYSYVPEGPINVTRKYYLSDNEYTKKIKKAGAKRKALHLMVKNRLLEEMALYDANTETGQKARENAIKTTQAKREAKLQQRAQAAGAELNPQNRLPQFPSKEDLVDMEKYQIELGTREPEFRVCRAISTLYSSINSILNTVAFENEDSLKIPDNIELRLRAIYQALNIKDLANQIKPRLLRNELYKLNCLKGLLQKSNFTVRQFRTEFDDETRRYLATDGNDLIKQIEDANLKSAESRVTIAYIKCQLLLREMTIATQLLGDVFEPYRTCFIYFFVKASEKIDIGIYHAKAKQFLVEFCGLNLPADISSKYLFIKMLNFFDDLRHIAGPCMLTLDELVACDPQTLKLFDIHKSTMYTFAVQNHVSVKKLVNLSPELFQKLYDNRDDIISMANDWNHNTVADFLALPTENLEFILDLLSKCSQLYETEADFAECINVLVEIESDEEFMRGQLGPYEYALQKATPAIRDLILNFLKAQAAEDVAEFLEQNTKSDFLPLFRAKVETDINHIVNPRNEGNDTPTPLHAAVAKGNSRAVRGLLLWGADIGRANSQGLNAIELAKKLNQVDVLPDLTCMQQHVHACQMVRV